MVASGTRKRPSLGELGGARAGEGGSHGQRFSSPELGLFPQHNPLAPDSAFPPAQRPLHSAPAAQSPRGLDLGAADSRAGPALNLGRAQQWGGTRGSGSGLGGDVLRSPAGLGGGEEILGTSLFLHQPPGTQVFIFASVSLFH